MPAPDSPASSTVRVLAVIPARYGATRFPGKPMALIDGKPMVQHVWERVSAVPTFSDKHTDTPMPVVIATEDNRIAEPLRQLGATVAMTRDNHPTGTDRVWEVAEQYPDMDWVINIQGDEPYINPAHIAQVVEQLATTTADVVTMACPFPPDEAFDDPNHVKVVLDDRQQALYFSRAPIPCNTLASPDAPPLQRLRHLGLYAYRRSVLAQWVQWPVHPLELTERLEQLRAMAHGVTFHVEIVDQAGPSVDVPTDIGVAEAFARKTLAAIH